MSTMEIHDISTPPKIICGVLKQAFSSPRIEPLPPHLKKEKTRLPSPLKDFLNYECEAYLKQPRPNAKPLLLRTPQKFIDMLLKLVGGRLSQSLEITYCATFALTMSLRLEDEAHFMLSAPSAIPLGTCLPPYFSNMSGSMKSFYQLDC